MDNQDNDKTALKRPHMSTDDGGSHIGSSDDLHSIQSQFAPISPPPKRRRQEAEVEANIETKLNEEEGEDITKAESTVAGPERSASLRSPFQLTAIRDLPPAANVDALTLADVFGDADVEEVWQFNFMHDVDFIMSALHERVRATARVHVVHGFWQREDSRRLVLEADAGRYSNVLLHVAPMPEMFGTHHSKMAVLFRRGGTAQVVIHTANMIPHDWGNMTQGVWRSPLLPLLPLAPLESQGDDDNGSNGELCYGERFKANLLNYLQAYNRRQPFCQTLMSRLAQHDFSAVRAVLVASVPGRHQFCPSGAASDNSQGGTPWGWPSLKRALQTVPVQRPERCQIVAQVSSIATLGPTDAWLKQTFLAALSTGKCSNNTTSTAQLQHPRQRALRQAQTPVLRLMFPTADEIRRSLNGYDSGRSIHTNIQSPKQQKQVQYLRPLLCHWANDAPDGAELPTDTFTGRSGRRRAAPHIKTYIRYGPDGLDWALLTSANLSKQAWGDATAAWGEVRIASWEMGVLVWPELLAEGARMLPVFGSDMLAAGSSSNGDGDDGKNTVASGHGRPTVALRMPYDLPVQPYGKQEIPWVATMPHYEADWRGTVWDGT